MAAALENAKADIEKANKALTFENMSLLALCTKLTLGLTLQRIGFTWQLHTYIMNTHTHTHAHTHTHTQTHTHTFTYIHTYTHTHTYMCVCMCV